MFETRPVSDLVDNLTEIEEVVEADQPISLTENGYGRMVIMSNETYAKLSGDINAYIAQSDYEADYSSVRLAHEEVFPD